MANQCQYLEYRDQSDEQEYAEPRAYCTVVDRFVQPMRADICNCRYGLNPKIDCEFFLESEDAV
jgi:hypothetical protein